MTHSTLTSAVWTPRSKNQPTKIQRAVIQRAVLPRLAKSKDIKSEERQRTIHRGLLSKLAIALCTLFPWLSSLTGVQAQTRMTLLHDGIERVYHVSLPSNYASSTTHFTLIVALHGRTQEAVGRPGSMAEVTGLADLASEGRFIAVFPEGRGNTGTSEQRDLSWNAGTCCPPASVSRIDDVGFLGRLVDTLIQQYRIDPRHVFATGISNGGMMCYRLAQEAPRRFKAFAAVAASNQYRALGPVSEPKPFLHLHALDDPLVRFEGNTNLRLESVPASINELARLYQCNRSLPDTISKTQAGYTVEWPACSNGARVRLMVTAEGGHSWFSQTSPHVAFQASPTILSFFESYTNPSTIGTEDGTDRVFMSRLNGDILVVQTPDPSATPPQLFNVLGTWHGPARSSAATNEWTFEMSGLPSGFYIVRSGKESKKVLYSGP